MRHFALSGWDTVELTEIDDTTTVRLTAASGDVETLVIDGDANADISLRAPSSPGPRAAAMEIVPGNPESKETPNG